MTIRLYQKFILLDSVTMYPFLPMYACTEEWLKNYMAEHPFPDNNKLNGEDIFIEFTRRDAGSIGYNDLTPEQVEWIEKCCNEMM